MQISIRMLYCIHFIRLFVCNCLLLVCTLILDMPNIEECSRCHVKKDYADLSEFYNKDTLTVKMHNKWIGDMIILCDHCERYMKRNIGELWFDGN